MTFALYSNVRLKRHTHRVLNASAALRLHSDTQHHHHPVRHRLGWAKGYVHSVAAARRHDARSCVALTLDRSFGGGENVLLECRNV